MSARKTLQIASILQTLALAVCLAAASLACGSSPSLPVSSSAGPSDAGVSPDSPQASPARGTVVAVEETATMTRDQAASFVSVVGLDASRARSGVALYRLTYRTVDAAGAAAIGSGLVGVPTTYSTPLPIVSYEHGTSVQKANVLSDPASLKGKALSAWFAASGYVFVAPDYLGLGLSSGYHPYLHAESEAMSSLDLLEAAGVLTKSLGVTLRGDVYVVGFSQGGQAALALENAVASSAGTRWRVPAVACIAGPYALSDTEFPFLLQGASDSSSTYLAYLVTAYQHIYGIYAQTSDAFNERYAGIVDGLFDGYHTTDQIAAALPRMPKDLFRADFVSGSAAPGSALLQALAANDTLSAHPHGKVRLYFGQADVDVSPTNSERTYQSMMAAGVDVALVPLGATVDHPGSEAAALPLVKQWFDALSSSS